MRAILRLPFPAILFGVAAVAILGIGTALSSGGPVTASPGVQEHDDEGFVALIKEGRGGYHKGGWNHYGPGHFELDPETGELQSHGGMGLLWFAERTFSDFVLELEFKTSKHESNSGIFLRVPEVPSSDAYIYHSFEVQIDDASEGVHRTGSAYDAEAASGGPGKGPGEWNHMRISFVGDRITVDLNDERVLDWNAEPRGKVEDFAPAGYIGLQNHDRDSSVWFRNLRIKDLSAAS
jgi:hypothetical protein